MRLVLVRHAMPALDPAVPPHEWQLGAEGHAAAQALAEVLREVLPGVRCARLVASEEPKAYQTLAGLGTVLRDPRFGEVGRGPEPWDGPFAELRRAYVEGAGHPGWEPRDQVAERFDAAVRAHHAAADGCPLVVGSHGMAITLWLASRLGAALGPPGEFWSSLRLPDVIAVDLAAGAAARPLHRG